MQPDLDELERRFDEAVEPTTLRRRMLLFGALVHSPEAADRALHCCAKTGEHPDEILELVLQAFLFAGFPRLINGLRSYRHHFHGSVGAGEPRSQDQGDIDRWRERGEELFRRIYAGNTERVLADLDRYHEDLRDWILVDAYGKILGRPALGAAERELAAVVGLMVSGDGLQLSSHLRGARHCGASLDDIDVAISCASFFVPASRVADARHVLMRISL